MMIPLPGGQADELMWHLRDCPTCRTAKVWGAPRCHRGQQLIIATLQERHGRTDQK